MSNSLNGVIIDAARRRLLDDWAIIQRWTGGSAPTTLTQALPVSSSPAQQSCCLLPNNKVAFIFSYSGGGITRFFIYDITTNTGTLSSLQIANSLDHQHVGYVGSDTVIAVSASGASNVQKYNYVTDVFTGTSAAPSGRINGFIKGPDGRFYTVPRTTTRIEIYIPLTSSFVNGPLHGQTTNDSGGLGGAFWNAVVTPFGKIIYIPAEATTIGIYDIATNTFSNSSYAGPIAKMFRGACLAPNGKVILAPHGWNSVNRVGIYDPIADTFQLGANTQTNVNYRQAILTPSGKIVFIPTGIRETVPFQYLTNGGNFGIYDPFNDTFSLSVLNPYGNVDPFGGGCLLPNGKIILGAAKSTTNANITLFEGGNDVIASHEKATLSEFINIGTSVYQQ